MRDVLAVILGGGRGSRLFPLTHLRSKPAVPIGGKYRLIDIPISNCLHADIRRIFVLTQFNSASLNRHVGQSYRLDTFSRGFVEILAAEQTRRLAAYGGGPLALDDLRETCERWAAALRDRLATPIASTPVPGIELAFDDEGSPWYTRCVASGSDRLGLLFALTSAFAAAGASVHAARIVTEATTAVDTFELSSSRSGGKIGRAHV